MTARSRIPAALLVALACGCGDDSNAPDEAAEGGGTGTTAPTDHGEDDVQGNEDSASTSAGESGSEGVGGEGGSESGGDGPPVVSPCPIDDGQCIFRHDTFGDEVLWTDVLRVNEMMEKVSPNDALALGLKLDLARIPIPTLAEIDREDPLWTVRLLQHDAFVGLSAVVEGETITRLGITCSLCHSTVNDAGGAGIGLRRDGWPNRDLDVGAILANAPGLGDFAEERGVEVELLRDAYRTWGPGRYDARFNMDLQSAPVLIPPAYGLEGVPLVTYTGDGGISYWNAYVAVTQMGGQGRFGDPALGLEIDHDPDLVTRKLPALRAYQHALVPPESPYDNLEAAARGEELFNGVAQCGSCHSGDAFTDAPVL
ncbi:MAG TPA: hypothetical protein VG755_40960, partial [Nannocystaceae bacterium]|nr:hypothetical protein [Nannocystaceae bacterium]